MFDKEFYPTSRNIIERMMQDLDVRDLIVLEPSAGKGDIVDYLHEQGAKQVLTYEKNKDLQKILESKSTLLGSDFFACMPETISHIDLMVMNPPFSNAANHIVHAWEIAPEGCQIIALCDAPTLYNCSSKQRKLQRIVSDYGEEIDLGECFSDAERPTNVKVSLIRLSKPILSENFNYEGFFLEEEETIKGGNGLIPYDEIRDIVGRYITALKVFDKVEALNQELKAAIDPLDVFKSNKGLVYSLGSGDLKGKEEFVKSLQYQCWRMVFNRLGVEKHLTSGVISDLNKFVQTNSKYPFTMRNIYRMIAIIVGTREHTMNRSLTEAVELFTKHTHENRYYVEGWKTNSGYMLNKKIIIPNMLEYSEFGKYLRCTHTIYSSQLNDLVKVLCFTTGVEYSKTTDIDNLLSYNKCQPNTWYDTDFFRIKGFKKGTLHLTFNKESDWEALNRAYAKIKGQVLPENFK